MVDSGVVYLYWYCICFINYWDRVLESLTLWISLGKFFFNNFEILLEVKTFRIVICSWVVSSFCYEIILYISEDRQYIKSLHFVHIHWYFIHFFYPLFYISLLDIFFHYVFNVQSTNFRISVVSRTILIYIYFFHYERYILIL